MKNAQLFINNYNYSIFKKDSELYLYIYNTYYYCLITFDKKIKVSFLNQYMLLLTYNNKFNKDNTEFKRLNFFLNQFNFTKYNKIKFTGKGYKIKKNSNKSIVLLFNRAHTTTLWWKNSIVLKLKKYKIYLKYDYKNSKIISTILNVRYINIFTKKGLRLTRQVLLKKKGKK